MLCLEHRSAKPAEAHQPYSEFKPALQTECSHLKAEAMPKLSYQKKVNIKDSTIQFFHTCTLLTP